MTAPSASARGPPSNWLSMRVHSMKTLKTTSAAAALALAAWLPGASAQGVSVLNQGFNGTSLPGWEKVNKSSPAGNGWYEGNVEIFREQGGIFGSYIAANHLSAEYGSGTVDNWLITPTLNLSGTTWLSFYTRASDAGFADKLEVRFSAGSGFDTAGFTTLLGTIGPDGYPTGWQQFSQSFDYDGIGRFAFRYMGDANDLSYIGIDTMSVVTAVPEPSLALMLGLGLGILPILRRKFAK